MSMQSHINPENKAFEILIDKISNAIGWVFTHDTPKRIAERDFIIDVESSDMSPMERYAVLSNHKRILKQYMNQVDIVEIAREHLGAQAHPDSVDTMWFSMFMDKARLISNEQYQEIWGRILAGECNKPGTYSKSLLVALEQMDKRDADYFMDVCACSIEVEYNGGVRYSPLITNFTDYYWKTQICFESLMRLTVLGLVYYIDFAKESPRLFSHGFSEDECPVKIKYSDRIINVPKGKNNIPLGNVVFTDIGEQLRQIVGFQTKDGFFEEICTPFFSEKFGHIE